MLAKVIFGGDISAADTTSAKRAIPITGKKHDTTTATTSPASIFHMTPSL
jgi:hypothetical protein